VLREGCALLNPFSQQRLFVGREWSPKFRWRHANVRVAAEHSMQKFTAVRFPGDHGGVPRFKRSCGTIGFVQPQAGLSLTFIRTMTGKTAIGQNRTNLAIEVDCLGSWCLSLNGNDQQRAADAADADQQQGEIRMAGT
jgi:hypothetical protein